MIGTKVTKVRKGMKVIRIRGGSSPPGVVQTAVENESLKAIIW
jgi:hypothetical protein